MSDAATATPDADAIASAVFEHLVNDPNGGLSAKIRSQVEEILGPLPETPDGQSDHKGHIEAMVQSTVADLNLASEQVSQHAGGPRDQAAALQRQHARTRRPTTRSASSTSPRPPSSPSARSSTAATPTSPTTSARLARSTPQVSRTPVRPADLHERPQRGQGHADRRGDLRRRRAGAGGIPLAAAHGLALGRPRSAPARPSSR